MGIFSFFRNRNRESESDNHVNHSEISKNLIDLAIKFLKEKNGGVRVEDVVALMCTLVAERCIEAAGDYSIYDHNKSPGQIVFSDNINRLLYGDCVTDKIIELPPDSVFGQIRGLLKNSPYNLDDFPSMKLMIESFAASVGKKEDWGKCPWSVPAENIPSLLPLKVGYETRNTVDQILKQIANKADKLSICTHALCEFLVMAKDATNPKVILLLAFETINGMSKTAPMTEKAMFEMKTKQANNKYNSTNTENPYQKKCKEYSDAINHDPQNVNLYVERSKAYRELKKYNLAIQDIETAIRLDPQRKYFFYFLRHLIFGDLGNLEKSLEDIKKAVKLAPQGYIYHKYLAKVYVKLGQKDNAVLAMKQEIEEYPKNRQSYLDSVEFFEGIGQIKDALENINKAIALEPKRLDSNHRRARIFIKMGQFDDALRDCNICIKIEPREWTHFRVRSKVYQAMGDTRSAEADYNKSMELNPCINR